MNTFFKRLKTGSLVGAFFLCTSVQAAEYLSVAQENINVRSGPGTDTTVIYEFPKGYPVQVLEHNGQWMKVADYEGAKGYIHANLLSKIPHVIVKVPEGNVRKGPGTSEDIVGKVVQDVLFEKIAQKGDWIQVRHPQLVGWVHKSLLWPDN
nr:SH3 domain-containing protein [uncultured Desulfobulbus sp.]